MDVNIKRREFVKRAVYAVPVILTLKAMPAFASAGSGRGYDGDGHTFHRSSHGKPPFDRGEGVRRGKAHHKSGDHR
jgi:hypothetical protein